VSYRPFDCTLMSYGPVRTVSFSKLTIVEGSYSLHDALRPLYDMRLFLSIDPVEQERRLRSRVDDERIHAFMQRWIPLEELYFKNMKPHEHCDYIL